MTCYYCDLIAAIDPSHHSRPASIVGFRGIRRAASLAACDRAAATRRWLSGEQHLVRYPHVIGPQVAPVFSRIDMRSVTDADVDASWSANADLWEAGYASMSSMPFRDAATFDAAVANYVMMDVRDFESALAEIARVLKPGGRFVCAISHQTLDARWHVPACDSPRREDRLAWLDDDYFVRRAGYMQWGDFKPFLSFHRPVRDYIATCKHAGLELRDLEEPEISEEGERALHPVVVRQLRKMPYSYVLRFLKALPS